MATSVHSDNDGPKNEQIIQPDIEDNKVVTFWSCAKDCVCLVHSVKGSFFVECLCKNLRSMCIAEQSKTVDVKKVIELVKNSLSALGQIQYTDVNNAPCSSFIKPQYYWPTEVKEVEFKVVERECGERCQNIIYYDKNIVVENVDYLIKIKERLLEDFCHCVMLKDIENIKFKVIVDLHFPPSNPSFVSSLISLIFHSR